MNILIFPPFFPLYFEYTNAGEHAPPQRGNHNPVILCRAGFKFSSFKRKKTLSAQRNWKWTGIFGGGRMSWWNQCSNFTPRIFGKTFPNLLLVETPEETFQLVRRKLQRKKNMEIQLVAAQGGTLIQVGPKVHQLLDWEEQTPGGWRCSHKNPRWEWFSQEETSGLATCRGDGEEKGKK